MSAVTPSTGQSLLSPQSIEKIEQECRKYPQRRAAIKTALRLAQQEHGWLRQDVMDEIAELLGMRPIQVYEVATFYDMFDTESVGKHRIRVCTNVSCMLCGSDDVVAHLKSRLGVDLGETTSDGRFTLREAECLSACGGAPMMMVDDDYHENLTPERIDAILDGLE